eukprot:SAG25_NODE_161_length_13366_cov_13.111973_15_plen_269_part_00
MGGRAVFQGARAFNGDLSAWNVGSVVHLRLSASAPASAVPSPRVCTRAGGCHSPPHPREFNLRRALHRGGWGGVGLSHRGARTPTTRSCHSTATGVRLSSPSGRAWGGGCVRAVFFGAAAFNGDVSAWNVSSVTTMTESASGPASIPPPAALVCAAEPGEVTLRPQPLSAASGGGEAGGRPASAGVRCPTVGLEPPTTRSCRSDATGVRLSCPSRRAWGVGCLRAVFFDAPGPCKCFHGPFNPQCSGVYPPVPNTCAGACHPSGKPCA